MTYPKRLLSAVLLLLCSLCTFVDGATDYYKVLGIQKNASGKQIKQAYRSKAKTLHPDVNDAENASELFSEVTEAYEVLSDDELKRIYDTRGADAVKDHQRMQSQGGGGGGGDPFSDFFGSMFGGGRRERVVVTPPIAVYLPVSLSQMYTGDDIDIEYERKVLCDKISHCERDDSKCGGPGIALTRIMVGPNMVQQVQTADDSCIAHGKAIIKNCKHCPDGLFTKESATLEVNIPPGSPAQNRLQYSNVGNQDVGAQPGAVIVHISEIKHPLYKRGKIPEIPKIREVDLHCVVKLKLSDALAGVEFDLPHPTDDPNQKIHIKYDGPVYHDMLYQVPNVGLPQRGGRGHLYITFKLQFPQAMSEEDQKTVQAILNKSTQWTS